MSTKDIEKENRLKAQSDKSYQELKEAMSNVEKAIDKAQTSINQRIDEAFSKIALEVERFFIERRNKKLQLEANIEVNRIELSLENNEMKSYSGTSTTTDYTCTEINSMVISEQLEIEEQSELEIVNDTEVDWDEDIIFDHSSIESKPITTEQQLTEVACLFLPTKYSSESLVSITQQELMAMKHLATDVEVFSANVLNIETELNSCVQFEEELPRKIWDPGLDTILL